MYIFKSLTMYAITAFFGPVASYFESCIGERCFTIPDSNETKTFSNANEWCKVKNSSLAIVIDETTQATLIELLNSMQQNEQQKQLMFIDLKLVIKERTWYLVNGIKYLGGISEQSEADYRHYGYIKTYSNAIFYAAGSQPNILRNFICEVEGLSGCFNNSTNYHLYRGRCYAKYENGSLTWYQAREICHSNDGDLAMFNYDTSSTGNPQAPFDTDWLNSTLSYWIGVRWRDWLWSSSGGGDESTYTSWSIDKPNTINSECVCVDPNGKPSWSWTDCDCTVQRQFVCLKIVPTTIATTAITAPPKTPLRTTSLSFANGTNSNALPIGLGAGIGGGVFLILLVVIVVVAVTLTRKRRRKNKGVESQHNVETTPSTTTPNIELKTPDRSDVYAHVVPSTQHPTNNKSQNDVIYAQPDFSNNPMSTLSDSDSSNVRQGKAKSILLEAPNDVCANAASVS